MLLLKEALRDSCAPLNAALPPLSSYAHFFLQNQAALTIFAFLQAILSWMVLKLSSQPSKLIYSLKKNPQKVIILKLSLATTLAVDLSTALVLLPLGAHSEQGL